MALPPGSGRGLRVVDVPVASRLNTTGYATAMIGKWHLGDSQPFHHPTAQGFDAYYGMLYSHDYRFPYVKTDTTLKIFRGRTPVIEKPETASLTQLYTQEAIKYIREQKRGKPFFLYLAHNMPHLPPARPLSWRLTEADDRRGVVSEVQTSAAKSLRE